MQAVYSTRDPANLFFWENPKHKGPCESTFGENPKHKGPCESTFAKNRSSWQDQTCTTHTQHLQEALLYWKIVHWNSMSLDFDDTTHVRVIGIQ